MREQLIQYVNLLFAGNSGVDEIREEILQNTLERFDDLIDQGKSPEAAYRLAITGIGDVSELLGKEDFRQPEPLYPEWESPSHNQAAPSVRSWVRALAIGLYIISPIPLFILDSIGMDTIGLCGTLAIVAAATILLLLFKKEGSNDKAPLSDSGFVTSETPMGELKKSIRSLIGVIGLFLYLVLSFTTGAWYITWLVFPLMGAVKGLVHAIFDLIEVNGYER